ncbi:hypothetical protein [Macellibacteroides fermentans]|uniref:hypothetical protein n=1 Tax=Macellibacteroides fermentans TaxID=879969 RepID=UPI00406C2B16
MERTALIRIQEYWLLKIQIDLLNEVEKFMKKNELNPTQLKQKSGFSRSQLMKIYLQLYRML